MTTAETAAGTPAARLRDTTPDHLLVTGNRDDFFEALRPGDVLLFQGADFLAGLAQLSERRTCYHSAMYLGPSEDDPDEHLMVHNVSYLWWFDTGRRDDDGTELVMDMTIADEAERTRSFVEAVAANLAEVHLRPWGHLEPSIEAAASLLTNGGVGVVAVEQYLDRHSSEWLYGERPDDHDAVVGARSVHHIRSVTALRHVEVDAAAGRPHEAVLQKRLLDQIQPTALDASPFNPAELISFIPEIMDRPGYKEWHRLRQLADAQAPALAALLHVTPPAPGEQEAGKRIARERLRTIDEQTYHDLQGGPGWICASFVDEVYRRAGLGLGLHAVRGVKVGKHPVPLSTPRDLWDCTKLRPQAMFARGPERWEPPATPPSPARRITVRGSEAVTIGAVRLVRSEAALQFDALSTAVVRASVAPTTRAGVAHLQAEVIDVAWFYLPALRRSLQAGEGGSPGPEASTDPS